jgi:hypothetical protein
MAKSDQKQGDGYSDVETERRAEAALKRMLTTPHKMHKQEPKRRARPADG